MTENQTPSKRDARDTKTCTICDSSSRMFGLCSSCLDKLSKGQAHMLLHSPHLVPVAFLPDDDLLVLDQDEVTADDQRGHYGPYVLMSDGSLQDINYHYCHSHQLSVPCYEPVKDFRS